MGRKGGGDGFFSFSSGRDVTPAAERRPKRSEGSAKGAINQLGGEERERPGLCSTSHLAFFSEIGGQIGGRSKKYHEGEKRSSAGTVLVTFLIYIY